MDHHDLTAVCTHDDAKILCHDCASPGTWVLKDVSTGNATIICDAHKNLIVAEEFHHDHLNEQDPVQ